MKRVTGIRAAATVVGLACAGAVAAQQQQPEQDPFVDEQMTTMSCNEVDWHADMLANHGDLIGACQEAVVANGQTWARFSANFNDLRPDGDVVFTIRDPGAGFGGSDVGDVVIQPAPGQMAYINERRTPFEELQPGEPVELYVPEGHYGFATLPGAPMTQVADVRDAEDTRVAQAQQQPRATATTQREPQEVLARLPDTAGPLPWLAVGGALSLLGGIGLGIRRRLGRNGDK